MRKGFTEENSKEMEVVLKVRVPVGFDRDMESKLDEALADTLFALGYELVDSKEYRDVPGWSKGDGLDRWRRMVVDEIDLNYEVYDLSEAEKDALLDDVGVIDSLAKQMEIRMQRGDRNEYEALEIVFQKDFPEMIDAFRKDRTESLVDGLGLFYDASVNGQALFVDCWKGETVEIFLADDGGLMCKLPDEDEPRALRERIQDVEPGDAFLFGDGGSIRTSSEAAHQNFDEPDNPWILYGDDGDCYFEEDFGPSVGQKMRELLLQLPARNAVEQHIEDATYVSVWDGGYSVETACKVNRQTGEVFDIEVSEVDADGLDVLEEEYVRFADGTEVAACEGHLVMIDTLLDIESIRDYMDSVCLDDYDLGGCEITEDDLFAIRERVHDSGSKLEDVVHQYLLEIREMLDDGLEAADEEVTDDFPLRNYEDAVSYLCEVLNERDAEMDLEGDKDDFLKIAEFVPIEEKE